MLRLGSAIRCVVPFLAVRSLHRNSQFSSVLLRYTLQHVKILRGCRPAKRRGFTVHADTVLWRWRTSANGREDRSRWLQQQRWNLVCRVPLLFSARPDLHVLTVMVIDILLGYLIVYRTYLYCVMADEGCKSKADPVDCIDTDPTLSLPGI